MTLFQVIEDAVVQALEDGAYPGDNFRVRIDPEHLKALLEEGLATDSGRGDRVPVTTKSVVVKLAGHLVTLVADEPEEEVLQ